MELTQDKELAIKLIDEHFKVGNWYRFQLNCGSHGPDSFKLMKVTKIQKKADRYYLKGNGFTVNNGALLNPSTSKDESVLLCWAEESIKSDIQYTEAEVKEIFMAAAAKVAEKLFD